MKKIITLLVLCIFMLLPGHVQAASFEVDETVFEGLNATGVIVAQTDSGEILYQTGADVKVWSACTTKLLTAMIVLDRCRLDDMVTVNASAINSVSWEYVKAGIYAGEQFTVEQLLSVMLTVSANDVANVLAEHVAGSVSAFAELMNARAAELGCTASHFVNPSGIHNTDHYSTARDMLKIGNAAAGYSKILEITSRPTSSLPATSKSGERLYKSTIQIINTASANYCDLCVGGKTGFTNQANNCLVAFSRQGNTAFTVVIMNEKSGSSSTKFAYAKKVFEYLHGCLVNKKLADAGAVCEQIRIKGGTRKTRDINAVYGADVSMLINLPEEEVEKNIQYDETIKAPVTAGQQIGKITFTRHDKVIEVPLLADRDVEKSYFWLILIGGMFALMALFVITVLILRTIYRHNRRKKKHARKQA